MSFSSLCEDLHRVAVANSAMVRRTENSKFMKSLITEAAKKNYKDVINLLIKLGVEVDLEEHLNSAIDEGNVKLATFLLESGARIENLNWKEKTLCFCVFSSREKMLRLLLKYNLDATVRKEFKRNILSQLIVSSNSCNNNHSNAVEVSKILLNSGVSVDEVDEYGFSPLTICIVSDKPRRNIELISFLIEKGANINNEIKGSSDLEGFFPLELAVAFKSEDLLDLLLLSGVEINFVDPNDGWTALHAACRHSYKSAIEKLLHKGADINILNAVGETAFKNLLISKSELHDNDDHDCSCNTCIYIMIQEISKLSFKNLYVNKFDIADIQRVPRYREYFAKCMTELDQMTKTRFYSGYSYYSVLEMSKSIKKLANLTRNEEFVSKFQAGVTKFPCYQNQLKNFLKEAMKIRDSLKAVHFKLLGLFKDSFPDVVIRNLAGHLTLKDLALK